MRRQYSSACVMTDLFGEAPVAGLRELIFAHMFLGPFQELRSSDRT